MMTAKEAVNKGISACADNATHEMTRYSELAEAYRKKAEHVAKYPEQFEHCEVTMYNTFASNAETIAQAWAQVLDRCMKHGFTRA